MQAQNATDIINRYLDTVSNGNLENWNKIKSAYIEYEVYHSQQNFEQATPNFSIVKAHSSKLYKVWPDKEKIEIYEDSTFSRLLSSSYYLENKTVLIFHNMDPIIKSPWDDENMYFEFISARLQKLLHNNRSITLLGLKEFPVDGITCYEIEIRSKKFLYLIYFNTKTFLLE